MGNPPTLTRTLSDTISYKERSNRSGGGAPSYGSLQTVDGKYWEQKELIRRGNGEEIVTSHFVHSYTKIPRGSLLWLPDEDTDDNDAGHVVDACERYNSLAVRGSQWTLYVMKISGR